jgi:hypothetical protein
MQQNQTLIMLDIEAHNKMDGYLRCQGNLRYFS